MRLHLNYARVDVKTMGGKEEKVYIEKTGDEYTIRRYIKGNGEHDSFLRKDIPNVYHILSRIYDEPFMFTLDLFNADIEIGDCIIEVRCGTQCRFVTVKGKSNDKTLLRRTYSENEKFLTKATLRDIRKFARKLIAEYQRLSA